ncbi:hypothetical protein O181_067809 [Austropuccinia psidii MF-1]|uniref:Uncharacterized protein n=1 Tax=Austropuccinia psidii MF-1 TaxID=1389203 RepID=A0A9Q3EW41_9BASI|nr:hypothetical protein [Austropuccinia psidii MF-1]
MQEKQPSTTQASAKNSPSNQQQQLQCEKAAKSSEQGQRQSTNHKSLQPGIQNPKDSAGCHGKCISDGQNNDGIAEKGGSQTKILEMISDILDGIPNLYIAINDTKSHISDKNSLICNNLKANNLILSQINEKPMCFEKAHGHQSRTWWKTQIINKWANDAWRCKVETAFESAKFNADKDKALPWFCQQKDRLTALYPDMSEFMIHRKILRQCGGCLEHAVKSRTTEKSSEEYIINILEEVTISTTIGSSKVNLKTRFNTPWKDSVDRNPKENSDNIKYKYSDVIGKCHICQSTTHLANTCPKKGKINEVDIEKDPDVEKDEVTEDNSDDRSSIFSESSKDIENINATFDIMESYSPLPQLRNGQLDLSKIKDAQLMKTKPNRGKGYTACNSCITEVVIENKPIKLLLAPGAFYSCVGKSFLKTCVPDFEEQLLPIDGIKLNNASSPMKALGIIETTVIFPHINVNLRITVEFVMENCSSMHFILGNNYLIMYGIDLHRNKDRYFTIGDNKSQTFAFLPFKRQIKVKSITSQLGVRKFQV